MFSLTILFYTRARRFFFPQIQLKMSDSEAVVEKRRGRPAKDKSEDSVKEPKKRAREVEKKDKDVVKKDEDVPAKRGRGRPPKSGASAGKKTDKPKSKTGKRGRPKKSDKKEKEESAEEEDSKEENEDEDDE